MVQKLSDAAGMNEAARNAAHETLTRLEEVPGYMSILLVRRRPVSNPNQRSNAFPTHE